MSTRRSSARVAWALFGLGAATESVAATSVPFQSHDIRSVFHIAKSENRNQVHYGIHLDESCVPKTDTPVYVYWHDRERGPHVYLPLLPLEHSAYGIDSQRIQARVVTAGRVIVSLRALPRRELAFESYREAGSCRARAVTRIDDRKAVLHSVFVQLGALFSVEHIELRGSMFDGTKLREIIRRGAR